MNKKFHWKKVAPQLEYLIGSNGNHILSCNCPIHNGEFDLVGIIRENNND